MGSRLTDVQTKINVLVMKSLHFKLQSVHPISMEDNANQGSVTIGDNSWVALLTDHNALSAIQWL